ncbi:hypothetical protein PYW08_001754 [Mythimna loreyi]|uniref:Uncharacterized protein n=1 Tax=Mythimna loreyi TaxID=667449 RepID=A0ACC2R5I4_9NEOP|nr:hypothetical protein PYW08_001754 [Mythimna loreyi]
MHVLVLFAKAGSLATTPRATNEMARYQLLCIIIVATMDLRMCYGENSAILKEQESTLPELAKEVEDNSRYKTLEANATVLKLLVDDKNGVSRSEVFDMLHSRDDNEKHVDLPTFPEDAEDARAEVPSVPDSQAEFLQAPGEAVRKDSEKLRSSSVRGEPIGAAAGIMVLVTCSIVCLAYTALIVWRRIYLKRNGLKHELLRNEENIAETRIEL